MKLGTPRDRHGRNLDDHDGHLISVAAPAIEAIVVAIGFVAAAVAILPVW